MSSLTIVSCVNVSVWAAINLILDLKHYDVRPVLLSGLVALLRPTKEEVQQHQNTEGDTLVSVFSLKTNIEYKCCLG